MNFSSSGQTFVILWFLVLSFLLSILACGPGHSWERPAPKRPNMVCRQRYPDIHEKSLMASGEFNGKIKRGTEAFKKLKYNYDTNIVFKNDERNDADRIMTQRCEEKLKKLAELVLKQWRDTLDANDRPIKLRVIDAWEEDDEHEKDSLHYEGRAVDITTSDLDRKKYGILGRLAIEAGFDWVYYISKSHLHVSVKSDDDYADLENVGCFPSNASAQLQDGKHIPVQDIEIGDKVLSVNGKGEVEFSRVFMFLHYDPMYQGEFIVIELQGVARSLSLTPLHVIWKVAETSFQVENVFAQDIQPGDRLYIAWRNHTITTSYVSRVMRGKFHGAFAPLTENGNIIVDGVSTSCYAVIDHHVAHSAIVPLRFLSQINPNLLSSEKQIGVHWYAQYLHKIYYHLSKLNRVFFYYETHKALILDSSS